MSPTKPNMPEVEEILERRALDADFRTIFLPLLAFHMSVRDKSPSGGPSKAIKKSASILRKELDGCDDGFRLLVTLDLFVEEGVKYYRNHIGPLHLASNGVPGRALGTQRRAKRRNRERRG